MDYLNRVKSHKPLLIASVMGIIIVAICASRYGVLYTEKKAAEGKVKGLEEALKNSNDSLARVEKEKTDLVTVLNEAAKKNEEFATELEKVTGTVRKLERLTKTDPELLQKYSKIYFLNENYRPSDLTLVDPAYIFTKDKRVEIHDRIWPFLRDMIDAAQDAGVTMKIVSGYRSFSTQAQLKSNYRVTYGAGTANQFSADQGYSEHQLGTTVDLTTPNIGGGLTGFEKTNAYQWMKEHAHEYGFVLSYPPKNAYYIFEPWHWRFVGVELAEKLRTDQKYFYDLDQREISSYLINIFNPPADTTVAE